MWREVPARRGRDRRPRLTDARARSRSSYGCVGAPYPALGPDCIAHDAGACGAVIPIATTRTRARWPGGVHYRVPWLRGRPSPTRWPARSGRILPSGAPHLAVARFPTPAATPAFVISEARDLALARGRASPGPADHATACRVLELITRRPSDGNRAPEERDHKPQHFMIMSTLWVSARSADPSRRHDHANPARARQIPRSCRDSEPNRAGGHRPARPRDPRPPTTTVQGTDADNSRPLISGSGARAPDLSLPDLSLSHQFWRSSRDRGRDRAMNTTFTESII
jgi:hypothetical protein